MLIELDSKAFDKDVSLYISSFIYTSAVMDVAVLNEFKISGFGLSPKI